MTITAEQMDAAFAAANMPEGVRYHIPAARDEVKIYIDFARADDAGEPTKISQTFGKIWTQEALEKPEWLAEFADNARGIIARETASGHVLYPHERYAQ